MRLSPRLDADDLNFLAPDQSLDEYNRRYRDVFSQEHICKLMGRTPTYMTLDDHEIEDNWPSRATERDWVVKYPVAMHAYLTYQVSHSPLFSTHGNKIFGLPERLWYQFRNGCCELFRCRYPDGALRLRGSRRAGNHQPRADGRPQELAG
ncbi:MAG: alkaline phosphatase D family protein [Acidobacteriota bacterium]